jgi:hypothetical protein
MQKKIFLVTIFLISLILFGLLFGCVEEDNAIFNEEWLVCEKDSDCVLVQPVDCCPCGNDVINNKFIDEYNVYSGLIRVKCYGLMCAPCEQIFHFTKPECVENKCVVSVDCEKTCEDWEEKLKSPHLSQEYLDSMKNYLLDSGCECLTKLIEDYYSDSDKKDFIEKKIFTDSYGNFYKTYNISWLDGDADFVLIDPVGFEISEKNYETIDKYLVEWSRGDFIEGWGGSQFIRVGFKDAKAVEGYWTIRAQNLEDGFDDFDVVSSSMGASNVSLRVNIFGEINGENKNSYDLNEKINFQAYVSGPFTGLSDLNIIGIVKFRSEEYLKSSGKNFTEHDLKIKQFKLDEIMSGSEKTGSYSYVFADFFGGEGTYDFEFVADNLEGNAVTNNYGILCSIGSDCFGEIVKVPPFNRATSFQLFISGE